MITYWILCILFGTIFFSIVTEFCSAMKSLFGFKVLLQIHLLLSFPSDCKYRKDQVLLFVRRQSFFENQPAYFSPVHSAFVINKTTLNTLTVNQVFLEGLQGVQRFQEVHRCAPNLVLDGGEKKPAKEKRKAHFLKLTSHDFKLGLL